MGDDESEKMMDTADWWALNCLAMWRKEFFGNLIARMIPDTVFILIVLLGSFDDLQWL